MEITPRDLGDKWRRELIKRRALSRVRARMGHVGVSGDATYTAAKPRRISRLARYWLRPANLPEQDVVELAPLLTYTNTGVSLWRNLAATFTYTFFLWCIAMLAIGLTTAHYVDAGNFYLAITYLASLLWLIWAAQATFVLPRNALRHINTDAVTTGELEAFLPTARGELDRAYLNTVAQTLRQPVLVSVGPDIRSALRAVGDTVSALPGEPFAVGHDDPAVLAAAALAKHRLAEAETDSLVQASLLRQADGEERQSRILQHSGAAAKQARARHDETMGHINTLRSVLTVYESPETAARLRQADALQDAVRRVSSEAMATASAKRELEEEGQVASYGAPLLTLLTQTVGNGGKPADASSSGGVTYRAGSKWWHRGGGNG